MKDSTDKGTGDMFGEKRGRGRPKTGNAKTGAERQAAFRAKQQESNVTVTINRELNPRPQGKPPPTGQTPAHRANPRPQGKPPPTGQTPAHRANPRPQGKPPPTGQTPAHRANPRPQGKPPPTGQTHGLMDGLRFGRLPTSPRFPLDDLLKGKRPLRGAVI
ncbi:hypothetical protein CJI17_21085 [Aeromonas salmonicida]|nr:hypothetical protein CJI17_21085 [Aeromonas salmonicida]